MRLINYQLLSLLQYLSNGSKTYTVEYTTLYLLTTLAILHTDTGELPLEGHSRVTQLANIPACN